MTVNVDWRSIRPLNGGCDKGFEEFCSQLARSEVAGRARFIRKGSPDAGVECYAIFGNGSECAWQAKYFLTLGDSQWPQIDRSVRTALQKHPKLTRYVICLPMDLPDVRVPGQESALAKWDAHVERRWCTNTVRRFEAADQTERTKSRVHPKYKTKYRVKNWASYDRALVRRGDITIWLSPAAIAAWEPDRAGTRGAQRKYPDLAIESALTLRLLFHLPLRQAAGFPLTGCVYQVTVPNRFEPLTLITLMPPLALKPDSSFFRKIALGVTSPPGTTTG